MVFTDEGLGCPNSGCPWHKTKNLVLRRQRWRHLLGGDCGDTPEDDDEAKRQARSPTECAERIVPMDSLLCQCTTDDLPSLPSRLLPQRRVSCLCSRVTRISPQHMPLKDSQSWEVRNRSPMQFRHAASCQVHGLVSLDSEARTRLLPRSLAEISLPQMMVRSLSSRVSRGTCRPGVESDGSDSQHTTDGNDMKSLEWHWEQPEASCSAIGQDPCVACCGGRLPVPIKPPMVAPRQPSRCF